MDLFQSSGSPCSFYNITEKQKCLKFYLIIRILLNYLHEGWQKVSRVFLNVEYILVCIFSCYRVSVWIVYCFKATHNATNTDIDVRIHREFRYKRKWMFIYFLWEIYKIAKGKLLWLILSDWIEDEPKLISFIIIEWMHKILRWEFIINEWEKIKLKRIERILIFKSCYLKILCDSDQGAIKKRK